MDINEAIKIINKFLRRMGIIAEFDLEKEEKLIELAKQIYEIKIKIKKD